MSSNGSLKNAERQEDTSKLLDEQSNVLLLELADRLKNAGTDPTRELGIEVVLRSLVSLLCSAPPDTAHALINNVIERLNDERPPIGTPYHCDTCAEIADVADLLSKKIGRVDNESFVVGVTTVLRILLDSVRDDDLSEDLEDIARDNLFPADSLDADGPTFH